MINVEQYFFCLTNGTAGGNAKQSTHSEFRSIDTHFMMENRPTSTIRKEMIKSPSTFVAILSML